MTKLQRNTSVTVRVSVFILTVILSLACSQPNSHNPKLDEEMPATILWAWERPEDLRFLDPKGFGVAFLAQTIFLENDIVAPKPRRQPLEVPPGTYMLAVTRIETKKGSAERPSFSPEMAAKVVTLIKTTLDMPDVKAIQIDFDAVVSERAFYRRLMKGLRSELDKIAGVDARVPLTMTSLASWCTGDAWFNDFPVDEAVPMAFQMGADSDKIKTYLRNGNDWIEPLCRGSYGIAFEGGRFEGMKDGRRIYLFKNSAWSAADRALSTFSMP